MDSYVLSKKGLIKKTLFIGVVLLIISSVVSGGIVYYKYNTPAMETLFSIAYFFVFISIFLVVVCILALFILKVLITVGFWDK